MKVQDNQFMLNDVRGVLKFMNNTFLKSHEKYTQNKFCNTHERITIIWSKTRHNKIKVTKKSLISLSYSINLKSPGVHLSLHNFMRGEIWVEIQSKSICEVTLHVSASKTIQEYIRVIHSTTQMSNIGSSNLEIQETII